MAFNIGPGISFGNLNITVLPNGFSAGGAASGTQKAIFAYGQFGS